MRIFNLFKRKPKEKMTGVPMSEEDNEMALFVHRAYVETDPIKRNAMFEVLIQTFEDKCY